VARYDGSESQLAAPVLDEDVGVLVPGVEDLLRRICHEEPTSQVVSDRAVDLQTRITYPDGIGRGLVNAQLFAYRDGVRLDVIVDHNRMFATAGGTATDRRCFLNDFVASVTLSRGTEEVPRDFVREVVSGIAAARDAVARRNRHARGAWDEIRVATGD
jgi:hypothetical protein